MTSCSPNTFGAILVALLGCQAVITLIGAIIRDAAWYIVQQRNQSLFQKSNVTFPWENLIVTLVTVVLYLLVAYLLARWLYPAAPPVPTENADAQS